MMIYQPHTGSEPLKLVAKGVGSDHVVVLALKNASFQFAAVIHNCQAKQLVST